MVPKPAIFHMLKSMGINVEEVEAAAKQLPQIATHLAERVVLMDAKLDRILMLLEPRMAFDAPTYNDPTDTALAINPLR